MIYTIDRRLEEKSRSAGTWYDEEYHVQEELPQPRAYERRYYQKLLRLAREIGHLPPRPRILDVGCGTGKFLAAAVDTAACAGVDFSRAGIAMARRRVPEAYLAVASAERLPFAASSFDLVSCFGSLEHFDSMTAALAEIQRVLAPSGLFYLEIPNLFFAGYYLRYCFLGRSPGTGQVLERYAGFDGWRELLRSSGFEPVWEQGRNYPRGAEGFRPRWLAPILYTAWNLSAALAPAHLRENYCALARKSSAAADAIER